jgi:hypothetical protein
MKTITPDFLRRLRHKHFKFFNRWGLLFCLAFAWSLFTTAVQAQCSTAPASISGPTALCYGTGGTMITATGGYFSGNGQYQWGTGGIAGANVISGVTESLYINPSATTTYWVRRYDWWPCNAYTGAAFITVTLGSVSTAPISISATTSVCHTGSTLLTAIGGIAGTGSVYEWGTGYSVGDNIISEETGPSITVNPSVGTAYWVRRKDPAPCNRITGGPTITVSVPSTAPVAISGPTSLCYTDGGAFLTVSGGISGTNSQYEWGTGTVVGSNIITTSVINSLYINPMAPTDYWVRRKDPAPCNTVTAGVTYHVNAATVSGSPTSIAGITTICKGTSTTLTATGGTHGSGAYYEWGTGWSVGDNIIAGENAQSITVSPSVTTIYWVRRIDPAPCNRQTYGPTVTVTIPLPVTYSGSGWSAPPTPATPIIVASNLDVTGNLRVCSCEVINNAILRVHPNATLTVTRNVSVASTASMIVEDDAGLVQIDDAGTFTGILTAKRYSTPMKPYDYTYWSAPVNDWRLNQLSPLTLADKYYSFNPAINNWSVVMNGNAVMQRAKGYIVRTPEGWSLSNATSGVYQGSFIGTANTGTIPVVLQKSASGLNLIGNPYPCAVDIDQFLIDAVNRNLVNGTVYLWTHNTAISNLIPGNQIYNYTADDYAKYNLTGGIRTAATAITGGALPDGKIASGQGFFIEVNTALPAGNYTAYFRNSMRIEGGNASFFRSGQLATGSSPSLSSEGISKNRFWLNLSNAQGAFSQILVGYLTGATHGFDNLYDGKTLATANPLMMYTLSGSDTYAIEGRGLPFADTDTLPLGYKTTIAGPFTIELDNTDGFFAAQDIFIRDKVTGTVTNLKNAAYLFATAAGTFNTRFELAFRSNANTARLGAVSQSKAVTVIFSRDGNVEAVAPSKIASVSIYDLAGRRIGFAQGVQSVNFNTANPCAAGTMLLVKVTLEDGTVYSDKIILQ